MDFRLRRFAILGLAVLCLPACSGDDEDGPAAGVRPAAPVLDPFTSPTNGGSAVLAGAAPAGVALTASGGASAVQGTCDGSGRFSLTVPLQTAAGLDTVNWIEVTYVQGAVASHPAFARVVHDPVAPLTPDIPQVDTPTRLNPGTVSGTAEPCGTVTAAGGVAPASARAGADGSFTIQVPLAPNASNTLSVSCADAAGNVGAGKTVVIVHDDTPPAPASASGLRAYFDGVRLVVEGNYGSVEGSATVAVRNVTTSGEPVSVAATTGGAFVATLSGGANGNLLEVSLTDPAGNASLPPHTAVTASLAWSAVPAAGSPPSARVWAAAEYDFQRDRLLVFGGLDGTGARNDTHLLALAPGSEAWAPVSAASPPAARCGHSLHFDAYVNRVIVFGGTDPAGPAWFQDLQALDLSVPGSETWAALAGNAPPSARAFHAAAFDSLAGVLYVFGGSGAAGTLGDLWKCDLHVASPLWNQVAATGTLPPPLSAACAVLDAARSRLLLFGGRTQGGTLSNYLYALDLASSAWTRMSTTGSIPTPREGTSAALDPVGGRWLLFGGDTGASRANDLYVFDLAAGAWTQASPGGTGPSAREGACLAFDSKRLQEVLFGGSSDGSTGTFYGGAQVLK